MRPYRAAQRAHKFGQYLLGAQIGAGNMGKGYRARHTTLGHAAALKVLHPERRSARDRARFAQEVELTRRLAHAHTVSILDSRFGPGGAPYFAMEYVEGVDEGAARVSTLTSGARGMPGRSVSALGPGVSC